MAHYAFLDDNNLVTEVITGVDETQLIDGLDPETWYGQLRNQKCVRTSYNNNIRGVYAGIGYSYNEEEDLFVEPQPYPSWVREGSTWIAPVPRPQESPTLKYQWSEENIDWVVDMVVSTL
jgi:hypothetical protein